MILKIGDMPATYYYPKILSCINFFDPIFAKVGNEWYRFDFERTRQPESPRKYGAKAGIISHITSWYPGTQDIDERPKQEDVKWYLVKLCEDEGLLKDDPQKFLDMDVSALVKELEKRSYIILPLYFYPDGYYTTVSTLPYGETWLKGYDGIMYVKQTLYPNNSFENILKKMMNELSLYDLYLRRAIYTCNAKRYTGKFKLTDEYAPKSGKWELLESVDNIYATDEGKAIAACFIGKYANGNAFMQAERFGRNEFEIAIRQAHCINDEFTADMVNGVLDFAAEFAPEYQKEYLKRCFPNIDARIIDDTYIENQGE